MGPRLSLVLPLTASVATQDKCSFQSCIASEFDITVAIAHHPTWSLVDIEVAARTLNQTCLGFATVTFVSIRRFANAWVMCTIVDCIKTRSRSLHFCVEYTVHLNDYVFRKITSRDACLISHDNRETAIAIQKLDSVGRVGRETKPRWVVHVTDFFGDCSIAIDENCRS